MLQLKLQTKEPEEWVICFETQAELPDNPYIGFSALTGDVSDNHDIVSVNTYVASLRPEFRDEKQSPMAVDAVNSGRSTRASRRGKESKNGGAAGWFLLILKGIGVLAFMAFAVAAYVSWFIFFALSEGIRPVAPERGTTAPPSPTLSDSAILDSLLDDPRFDLSAHRERRLEELKAQVDKVRVLQDTEYGRVVTYGEEEKLIERIAIRKEKYCLVHFVHPDFQRCRIMDLKLDTGDVLIGFEELGDNDQFSTSILEFRLKQSGVFPSGPITLAKTLPTSLLSGSDIEDEDGFEHDKPRETRRGKMGIRHGFALDDED
ncbi:MAG: hypothetical protein TREMPRED_002757 [Tremellales sp. Tagirdzhanova-0007]|nr:MAG: hypothetical protein TREMPRED_002757 [Tremellales sp. Tagirdzhanova-0007]